jgi:hypothetical protein
LKRNGKKRHPTHTSCHANITFLIRPRTSVVIEVEWLRDASDMLFGDGDGQLAIQPDSNGLVKYHLPRLTKSSCQVGCGPNTRPAREELITFLALVMAYSAKHALKGSDVDQVVIGQSTRFIREVPHHVRVSIGDMAGKL